MPRFKISWRAYTRKFSFHLTFLDQPLPNTRIECEPITAALGHLSFLTSSQCGDAGWLLMYDLFMFLRKRVNHGFVQP